MRDAALNGTHRPWPAPQGRWAWQQSWQNLLFAHWPVPAQNLRALVPAALQIEEHSGSSWVGIVPFRMAEVAPRPFPPVPHFSTFPELNVRLYVRHEDKPGVWFLSLDATSRLAVFVGRQLYHVPYFLAQIIQEPLASGFRYRSVRRGSAPATFDADYTPAGAVLDVAAGSLEHFLTERYCLYAQAPDGHIWRTEVDHDPWPLQPANAEIRANNMAAAAGVLLQGTPLFHFAGRIDVHVWRPVAIS